MKKWFQSRTMWLNFATLAGGSIVVAMQTTLAENPMPDPWGGIFLALLGGANMILRSVTDTKIVK